MFYCQIFEFCILVIMLVHINSLLMKKQYPYLKVFLSSSSSSSLTSTSLPSIPPSLESLSPSISSTNLSKNKNSLLQVLRSKLKKSIDEDISKLNKTQIGIRDNVTNIIQSNTVSTSTIISSVMNTMMNNHDGISISSNVNNDENIIMNNDNSIKEDLSTASTSIKSVGSISNSSIIHKNIITLPSESIIISDFYKLGLSSEIITALYNQNINVEQ